MQLSWWDRPDVVRRVERALTWAFVLLSVLAACGGERIGGIVGFNAEEAIIAPCRTPLGQPSAVALAVSRRECWPTDVGDDVGLCDAFWETYTTNPGICGSDPLHTSRSRTFNGFFQGADRDDLSGISTGGAWVVDCLDAGQSREIRVTGDIEVLEDLGDVATVSFETDGLVGVSSFEICR